MDVVFHRSLLPRGSPGSTDPCEGGVQKISEDRRNRREDFEFPVTNNSPEERSSLKIEYIESEAKTDLRLFDYYYGGKSERRNYSDCFGEGKKV